MESIPPEAGAPIMKKILSYGQLVEAAETEDREHLLHLLVECAMTDIQMIRTIPNIEELCPTPIMGSEQEPEFRKKLRKACMP